ncbi:MAG: hypothetical protein LBQ87_03610 [Candidatus Fibromonas sp.]|jgi:hypothetical protein|nr:hypothetical protein [Candidatus Fibromonas sp.]
MRSKLLFSFMVLALFACSDDKNPTYPFERTVLDVSIAKRCKDGSYTPGANCYLMRWQHPIEKKDLQNYHVWLDTVVVKDSVQDISQSQINQAYTVPYSGRGTGDSLDLTDLISGFLERDSLHVAILARYSGGDQGAVQHIHVHFGDDVPPSPVSFNDSASVDTIWIDWIRPADQRDFYRPDAMNGPIAGYNISIQTTEDISKATITVNDETSASNYRKSCRFRKQGRSVELESISNNNPSLIRLAIPDGKGVANDTSDNWRMKISGLKPEQSYSISIVAFDSAGNSSSVESRNVATTDAIPPLITNEFRLYKDPNDGLPRLDSNNRLILFWSRSVDPLRNIDPLTNPAQIYYSGTPYREVRGYSIEQWNSNSWEAIPRISPVHDNYYGFRYRLENDSMKLNYSGEFVSDTLRWVLPGDTVILRIRAIDSSGHYSRAWIDTVAVSKGELWQSKCPENFAPVKKDGGNFCMEKLQHVSNDRFKTNVLYMEAKKICENLGWHLCTEEEWNTACNSGGSDYGIIEEKNFGVSEFLFSRCGVGTGDSISANDVKKRNKTCASPDGIRDLPGQLQEWVAGSEDSSFIKGSSYPIFQGASRLELAQCKNRFTPTRIRPRYITDTVFLYRTGSRIDTLPARDTLRTGEPEILLPSTFPHTLLFYTIRDSLGTELGIDYVNLAEYRRRGGNEWLNVLWQGLKYEPKDTLRNVLIMGTESIPALDFFLDPTVGFRCCTAATATQ